MELTSFGTVIKFAIDREKELGELAAAAGKADMEKLCGKNVKLLERTRRESVNEMILQPIDGLDSSVFILSDAPAEPTAEEAAELIPVTLENMVAYYKAAGEKMFIPEVRSVLLRIAKKWGKKI